MITERLTDEQVTNIARWQYSDTKPPVHEFARLLAQELLNARQRIAELEAEAVKYKAMNSRLTADTNAANRRAYLAGDQITMLAQDGFDRQEQLWKAQERITKLEAKLAAIAALPDEHDATTDYSARVGYSVAMRHVNNIIGGET